MPQETPTKIKHRKKPSLNVAVKILPGKVLTLLNPKAAS